MSVLHRCFGTSPFTCIPYESSLLFPYWPGPYSIVRIRRGKLNPIGHANLRNLSLTLSIYENQNKQVGETNNDKLENQGPSGEAQSGRR